MADTLHMRLVEIIQELRRIPDVVAVALARRDGLLIAHLLPKNMDPKRIAAMAASIVGTSEMAAQEMGLGTFFQSIVDSGSGKMLATGAGEETVQTVSDLLDAAAHTPEVNA